MVRARFLHAYPMLTAVQTFFSLYSPCLKSFDMRILSEALEALKQQKSVRRAGKYGACSFSNRVLAAHNLHADLRHTFSLNVLYQRRTSRLSVACLLSPSHISSHRRTRPSDICSLSKSRPDDLTTGTMNSRLSSEFLSVEQVPIPRAGSGPLALTGPPPAEQGITVRRLLRRCQEDTYDVLDIRSKS